MIKFFENVCDEFVDFLPGFITGTIVSFIYEWVCYLATGSHSNFLTPIGVFFAAVGCVYGFVISYSQTKTAVLDALMSAVNGANVGCGVLLGNFLV